MANILRLFSENSFYHVYNRGVHREAIFYEEFDYQFFLQLVEQNCKDFDVTISAYCLMRNHYHFLLRLGSDEQGIRLAISSAAMSYVHYFNIKYKQSGRLFQGPYRSKIVATDEYLLHLTHYIHSNSADFCDPLQYRWSSVASYMNRRAGIADPNYVLRMLGKNAYQLEVRDVPPYIQKEWHTKSAERRLPSYAVKR